MDKLWYSTTRHKKRIFVRVDLPSSNLEHIFELAYISTMNGNAMVSSERSFCKHIQYQIQFGCIWICNLFLFSVLYGSLENSDKVKSIQNQTICNYKTNILG